MVHGVLLVNKTSHKTSHNLVSSLRHIIGQKEVGHAGTLDPMAEGLMIILLGYGTKLSHYLLTRNKRYRFSFRLGIETDTLDKTGTVVSTKEVNVERQLIEKVITQSQGKLSLPIPLFSAVKIKGKKLYEYGREKKLITPPIRDMFFYDLEIKRIQSEIIEVEISCSKGSYIRAWASHVGAELQTGACLEEITRLESSPFHVDSALTTQEIEKRLENQKDLTSDVLLQKLDSAFIAFSQALPHITGVNLSNHDQKELRQGKMPKNLKVNLLEKQKIVNKNREVQVIKVMSQDNKQMLALLEQQPFLSPKFLRVFPAGLS